MSARAVAHQYAQALYDVARQNRQAERVGRELTEFAALITSHAELRRVLESTAIPAARKRAVVQALLDAAPETSPEVQRLLLLLADRHRLMLLDQIAAAVAERVMDAGRVMKAELTSATPLDEAARREIVAALSQAVGRELAVTERVDPALIGGMVARVGSLIFDASVARHLERLRERLLTESAADARS